MLVNANDISPLIKARVERALANGTTVEQTLSALAQLDLTDTVAWLLAEEQAMRASCNAAALSRLLDMVLVAGLAQRNPSIMADLITLICRYADVVRADTAAAVAWVVPPVHRGDNVREFLATALKREPQHAKLLRVASEMAVYAGYAPEAHSFLTRLAQADDSQATVNYVYGMREKLPSLGNPRVRVALLSSFTVDSLVPYVDLEVRNLGLDPEFYVAPFNSWVQEVIADDSGLRRFSPEIAFLAVSIDDLVPELAGNPSASLLDDKGRAAVDQMVAVSRQFAAWSDGTLIVHSLYSAYRNPHGILDGRVAPSRLRWLSELTARLADGLQEAPRTYLLDMNELLLHRCGGALDNPKTRYLAHMRIGDRILGEVARAYARYIAPLKGLRRKCVVVDLDNTLWGGIVGEDGPHGVKLGDTSPGLEYQDFQRYLLSLTERGFLLAINSKNNPEDALEVIRSHEGMILREETFSAIRINWRPKNENMLSIAEELNIGVDSMIFLDDNPHERELMRQILPEVLTPELPSDQSLYRQTVELLPQLQSLAVTEEDRNRVQQYRWKRLRDQVRATTQSLDEYLLALEIAVEITRVTDTTLSRAHQLFERTNQFNLTTRRYDAGQLAVFARNPGWRFYILRTRDRFGDHGLVATALVRAEADRWIVDSFLMSCRVIGYGVETALLAVVSEDAREAGATALIGEYIATKKNSPARDFYLRHGFTAEETTDVVARWRRVLNGGSVARPTWIKVEVTDAA
ncbi:MAG: HAD-IIIC family phosphatase [Gammaproteobacteria bacterium]